MWKLKKISQRKKLDPKTISCYFIGYPNRSKGFRFYCPTHNTRIVETRHVVFLKDVDVDVGRRKESLNISSEENHTFMPKMVSAENEVSLPLMDNDGTQEISQIEVDTAPIAEMPLHIS